MIENSNAQGLWDIIEVSKVAPFVISHNTDFDELTIEVSIEKILEVVDQLTRNRMTEFTTLVDITAIDYIGAQKRFTLVYHFLSMTQNTRLRIHAKIGEDEIAPSICALHPSANWFEREVFDMFGIVFSGHPDMRRILTDYGFEGHPLRKDFPTSGYVQMRYDEVEKKCVYEPTELVQDYRQFDFLSPWENAKYILPGDEKGK